MPQMSALEMGKRSGDLMKVDIDALHAYDQAIENTELISLRKQLAEFRADHERHVEQLRALTEAFDVVPPDCSQDFKGFLMEGFTALRSLTGVEGALKAMKSNEELTNRKYREALALGFTPRTRELLERNYEEEQVHLQVIERALAERIWEK
ncbi:MAG: ferritin-like domain-containing protein [Deltaproteobacteria bacterium]|nr:ferritin-like domain-containing protein [Deltaproteobacteria bacterium]